MAYDLMTEPITVTQLNATIKALLDEAFCQIVVIGEISGFKRLTSGHWYFDLKDKDALISCAVWRSMQGMMPRVQDGDLVIAHGQLSLYAKTGKITFVITRLELKGDGELMQLIEKRKQYYSSLGWFDQSIKKELPEEIHKLGVVTSATGAAFQDILNITKRRAPSLDIILFPAVVQGDGAATTIASRIRQANNFDACDVLIVGRGGGSQEDLSCFSADEVIEAIHESKIPIISAVGHEIDFPLSDYAADKRAPTPSAAAELVTETIFNRKKRLDNALFMLDALIKERILKLKQRIAQKDALKGYVERKLYIAKAKLGMPVEAKAIIERKIRDGRMAILVSQNECSSKLDERINRYELEIKMAKVSNSTRMLAIIQESKTRLSQAKIDINHTIESTISAKSSQLREARKETEALSPLAILSRGYSIAMDKNGKTITSIKDAEIGEELTLRVKDGRIDTIVKDRMK